MVTIQSSFLKKLKKGKVLAIEPSSENLKLCKKNIELNNLNKNNVNFVTAGVSDVNQKKKFFMSKQSNLHTFNIEGSAKRYLSGELRFIETFTVHNLSKRFLSQILLGWMLKDTNVKLYQVCSSI